MAARPDHPHLFAGPDVLIGDRGAITALFIPSWRDSSTFYDLIARLIASKLALPSKTSFVLVLSDADVSLPPNVDEQFSRTIALDGETKIASAVKFNYRTQDIVPMEIRKRANDRFALITGFVFARSRRRSGLSSNEGDAKVHNGYEAETSAAHILDDVRSARQYRQNNLFEDPSTNYGIRKPKNVFQDETHSVAATGDLTKNALHRTRNLCVFALREGFSLDRGIPYPRSMVPNVLIADRLPSSRVDSGKPLTALAFAGWAALTADSFAKFAELEESLLTLASRRGIK